MGKRFGVRFSYREVERRDRSQQLSTDHAQYFIIQDSTKSDSKPIFFPIGVLNDGRLAPSPREKEKGLYVSAAVRK